MGLIFSRDNSGEKFARLHAMLSDSFSRVRKDSALLTQWVEYLYHLSIEQQRSFNDLRVRNNQLQSSVNDLEHYSRRQNEIIRDLQLQLKHMPTTREDIRKIVDTFYSFEPVLSRIKQVEQHIADIEAKKSVQHIPSESVQKDSSFKEKILRRITRNSKNFIKNSIRSLVTKYGKISALQMREIIVEEQGLCSKSSFYRLLEELEKTEGLRAVSDGKEKIYFAEPQQNSSIKSHHDV